MTTRIPSFIAAAIAGLVGNAAAVEIPAQLPRPDDKPGDASKPVKVPYKPTAPGYEEFGKIADGTNTSGGGTTLFRKK